MYRPGLPANTAALPAKENRWAVLDMTKYLHGLIKPITINIHTWFSNPIEAMSVSFLSVKTVFTIIKIVTCFALEPGTSNWTCITPIT